MIKFKLLSENQNFGVLVSSTVSLTAPNTKITPDSVNLLTKVDIAIFHNSVTSIFQMTNA